MPADEQIIAQEHNQPTAAPQQSAKQARSRQSDDGPEILPCMEHFVTLVRKAKRPGLALLLVERASATSLPEVAALTDAAKGILAVQSRKAMFHAVAKLGADVQQHIERAAERVPHRTDDATDGRLGLRGPTGHERQDRHADPPGNQSAARRERSHHAADIRRRVAGTSLARRPTACAPSGSRCPGCRWRHRRDCR